MAAPDSKESVAISRENDLLAGDFATGRVMLREHEIGLSAILQYNLAVI